MCSIILNKVLRSLQDIDQHDHLFVLYTNLDHQVLQVFQTCHQQRSFIAILSNIII
uniref:Uncharacterized protein n=1 Tax=Schistosoma curassoni TaxID=6186 RepID=A0A183KTB0_9TREM